MSIKLLDSSIRLLCLFALQLMFLASLGFCKSAVEQDERRHLFDVKAYMANGLKVGPEELNSGLVGDFINLDKGSLSFSNTDIDLPGNFSLPVQLTRTISGDKYSPKFITTGPTSVNASRAVWGLDLPYITLATITPSGTVGCLEDRSNVDIYYKNHVGYKNQYYEVPRFHAPGGSGLLLESSKKSPNTEVFGKNPPEFTNNESWKISQIKKNGKCTWKAKDTKGNTYYFEQPVVLSNFNGTRRHAVVVTKVTDINGNWVKYSYDNKRGNRISRIYSSDDRVITFHYNNRGRLSKAVANGRTWTYSYDTERWWGDNLHYLKKVTRPDGLYWEYDSLKGASAHIKNRCVFGSGAYVRHPSGVKAYFKTKKIVNFAEARPPYGYIGASQRAACLPSKFEYQTNFYEKPILSSIISGKDQAKFEPLDDGKSKHGIFVTFFSSAPVEKKLVNIDKTESIWKYVYSEGDLYNPDMTKNSDPTVHKSSTNKVAVNTKLGKVRHVIDPFGTKHEFTYGRSLTNTGDLLRERIFEKGSTSPVSVTTYEYIHSANRLGIAWYQSNVNTKTEQYWTRTAKTILTLGGETYTTKYEYDDRAYQIKATKSSTLQKDTVTVSAKLLHKLDIWVLGLPISISVNGKEFVGAEYDSNGQVILETKFGNPLRRYKLNEDGTLAASRNGKNETTFFESYKRGTPQKVTLPNGAVYNLTIDDNGWMTRAVTASGYAVNVSHNKAGWVTKVDRPAGYADTSISYEHTKGGLVQSVRTEDKIILTTLDGFHQPTKVETRDATGQIPSVYILTEYDKLQRPKFESVPSASPSETAGVRTSYDALSRVVEKKETVSPFSTTKIEYLTDNRTRTTDVNGNKTIVHLSGFGSPLDGFETLVEKPNGLKIYFDHDKWHNVTSVRQVGAGKTLTNSYEYDSRFQLCLQTTPEIGREFFAYNSINQLVKSQKNAPSTLKCETPSLASINLFSKSDTNNITTTTTIPTPNSSKTTNTTSSGNTSISKNTTTSSNQNTLGSNTSNSVFCKNCNQTRLIAHSETIDYMTYYSYDVAGLLASIDYPLDTEDIKHYYDKSENLIKTERGNVVIDYTYGLQNELKSESLKIDGVTYTVEYTFNTSGGLTSYKTPSDRLVNYTLNSFNQITSIQTDDHTLVSNAIYLPSGILGSALYSNGYTLTNTVNKRTFIESSKLANSLGSLFDFSFQYGKGHQVSSIKDNLNVSRNRAFTYDELNRLITANGPWGKGSFTYDVFDNLLTKTLGKRKVTLEYDNSTNRLVKSIDTGYSGTRIVSHDNRGNVSILGTLSLTHDYAERLTSLSGSATSKYSYSGNLHRIKTVENGETTHWFYARSGKLLFSKNITTGKFTEYVSFENSSSLRINENGVRHWIYTPPFTGFSLGLDENGNAAWKESTSPYGETFEKSVVNNNQPAYAGHVRDEESGLSYMKARFYDPILGRFISPDPVTFLSGGIEHLNRYLYVSGDPINYWDPLGLAKVLMHLKAYTVTPRILWFKARPHLFVEYANPNDPSDRYIFRAGAKFKIFALPPRFFITAENTPLEESRDNRAKFRNKQKKVHLVTTIEVDIGDASDAFENFKHDIDVYAVDMIKSRTTYLLVTDNSNSGANALLVEITGDKITIDKGKVSGDYYYTGRTSRKPGSRIVQKERFKMVKKPKRPKSEKHF